MMILSAVCVPAGKGILVQCTGRSSPSHTTSQTYDNVNDSKTCIFCESFFLVLHKEQWYISSCVFKWIGDSPDESKTKEPSTSLLNEGGHQEVTSTKSPKSCHVLVRPSSSAYTFVNHGARLSSGCSSPSHTDPQTYDITPKNEEFIERELVICCSTKNQSIMIKREIPNPCGTTFKKISFKPVWTDQIKPHSYPVFHVKSQRLVLCVIDASNIHHTINFVKNNVLDELHRYFIFAISDEPLGEQAIEFKEQYCANFYCNATSGDKFAAFMHQIANCIAFGNV